MNLIFPVSLVVIVALVLLGAAGRWIDASADRRENTNR